MEGGGPMNGDLGGFNILNCYLINTIQIFQTERLTKKHLLIRIGVFSEN